MFICVRRCMSIQLLRSLTYAHITTKNYSIEKKINLSKQLLQINAINRSSPLVMSKFTFSSVDELIVEHNKSKYEFFIKLGNGNKYLYV